MDDDAATDHSLELLDSFQANELKSSFQGAIGVEVIFIIRHSTTPPQVWH